MMNQAKKELRQGERDREERESEKKRHRHSWRHQWRRGGGEWSDGFHGRWFNGSASRCIMARFSLSSDYGVKTNGQIWFRDMV
ncbi:hypothetical protein Hanom_Chr13g01196631 [Helianthus anomalus]